MTHEIASATSARQQTSRIPNHRGMPLANSRTERTERYPVNYGFHLRANRRLRRSQTGSLVSYTRSRLASCAASVIARKRDVASYRAATASNVVSDQHAHASADSGYGSSNPAIGMDSTKARRRYARPHHGTEMSASATPPLLPPESSTRVGRIKRSRRTVRSTRSLPTGTQHDAPSPRCRFGSTGPAPAPVHGSNLVR